MSDTPLPTTKRKMALTERETQLVLEHRQRTAADAAFNEGLDHALECLPSIPDEPISYTYDEVFVIYQDVRRKILAARRDV